MANFQVGTVQGTIRRTLRTQTGAVLDISLASLTQFLLKSPRGKLVTKTATFTTTGTDGQMQCQTSAGELDVAGAWRLQAKVVFSSGQTLWSEVQKFPVLENVTP